MFGDSAGVVVWWVVHHDSKLKAPAPQRERSRPWFSGLVVVVATIVSFIGFARVSVGWTLLISSIIFVALAVFLWWAGGQE
jgi:hypothetical protein